MADELTLTIETEEPPESTLIVAFPGPGMAGVSANQYLIEQLDLRETGHIQAAGLPSITPFVDGRPYHHTRLFSTDGFDSSLLTSELPVPYQHSEPFGRILLDWIDEKDVNEVVILVGLPSVDATGELFYVASDDYYDHRLADRSIEPLQGGFLTGTNASLLSRAMDTTLRVGVIATATNPRHAVDGDATVRLVEGLDHIYGFDVEIDQLRQFADRTRQHYEGLAEQMDAQWPQAKSRRSEDYGFM